MYFKGSKNKHLWMLETSLLLTLICCLSLFLELQNEEKKIVSILRLSINYFPILKNSVTYLSNSCDSKTHFTSFQSSFLSARIVNPQLGE